jgi:hypothetical protein
MALLCLVRSQLGCYCADRVREVPPLKGKRFEPEWGVSMKVMHLCYAAIGFAVARWLFKRQAVPVADPVTRFRSQGLL